MGHAEKVPSWSCYHTTDIMRCGQCGLIFCGRCHRMLVAKGISRPLELLTACPHCRGTVLIDLSPESPPIDAIERPAVASFGMIPVP
ncbi:MAG: hypothetical protein HGA96_17835 [Desulfobulbaceae bacterium]|nr:hypothetical protein [Desulfobulbaceae bacterium]